MDAAGIIARLRDRQELSQEELRWFADGLARGTVSDAQAGAFAMAAFLNGLGEQGRVALTAAMRDSGDVLRWDLPGPVLDKHSTGGVGDCVSIPLAPALAACGAFVPMISGRGLGHTGGTLDKLEAIPGVNTQQDEAVLRRMVGDIGCAIVSATGQIAPADKRLYAIRDVTGTVESIDLITASILSKKLAAGLEGLVLDVKCGSGAFMQSLEEARALALALTDTANGAGCQTVSLITDMDQPLAPSLGNALEIADCMTVLEGHLTPPLARLTCVLGGELLALGGLAADAAKGAEAIGATLGDGRAMERFDRMITALGGPANFCETWQDHLPLAPVILDVPAPRAGHVRAMDGRALGHCVVELGGGRLIDGAAIDPAVGLSGVLRLGDRVEAGDPLARVHAADREAAEAAVRAVQSAIDIGNVPIEAPLIIERIAG